MEMAMLVGTGLIAAASLAVGVGFGYVSVRLVTAALEWLFKSASAETASVPATVVPFVSPHTREQHAIRKAA